MHFKSFVIAAPTSDLSIEPAARELADALEFRMDHAEKPLSQLEQYDGELPLIATNRAEWEGGDAAATPERAETLETAVEHPSVEAVDIELHAIEGRDEAMCDAAGVAELASEHGVSTVASVHDFDATPSRKKLDDLLDRSSDRGDVGKVAVTAGGPDDVLTILAATLEHANSGDTVATMAMGSAGRHSRAVCPLYGSRIAYAPLDPADATAPGQYDLQTLRSLIDSLGGAADRHDPN